MESRMRSHERVPTVPVDIGDNRRSGFWGHVVHHVKQHAAPLQGVGDPTLAAVPPQRPGVAGLPTAPRVEHRPVQNDAVVRDGGDRRLARSGVCLDGEQLLGHAQERIERLERGYEWTETWCAPGKFFSPARIGTVTQFSPGGIGQDQFGLYAQDGL
jgi:hypothetical protein